MMKITAYYVVITIVHAVAATVGDGMKKMKIRAERLFSFFICHNS
ncbi:hypothetical protein ACIU4M_00670 [Bacillus altitudinis]